MTIILISLVIIPFQFSDVAIVPTLFPELDTYILTTHLLQGGQTTTRTCSNRNMTAKKANNYNYYYGNNTCNASYNPSAGSSVTNGGRYPKKPQLTSYCSSQCPLIVHRVSPKGKHTSRTLLLFQNHTFQALLYFKLCGNNIELQVPTDVS